MKLTPEHFSLLENTYLRYFPAQIPEELLQDYQSILENKELIRYSKPDRRIVNYLLDAALQKIENKKKFQKISFIKLIRAQAHPDILDNKTLDKLFSVFKVLILEVNEEIAWKLSITLKDIQLSDEQVKWLIDYYNRSEHIQNRLLRYPMPNRAIANWAKTCMDNGELSNRESELIALRLNFDKTLDFPNKTSMLWVHYCRLETSTKKKLLRKYLTANNLNEFIKICEKNNFIDLIEELYKLVD